MNQFDLQEYINLQMQNKNNLSHQYTENIYNNSDDITKIKFLTDTLIIKLKSVDIINSEFIDDMCSNLKKLVLEHNEKINDWFDEKYNMDLNKFKYNDENFSKLIENNLNNSFILINDYLDDNEIDNDDNLSK